MLTILARDTDGARDVGAAVGGTWGALADLARLEPDAVVNATPVGGWPDPGALPVAPADLRGVVFDMVTTPPRTPLLREAERRGLRTVDGLSMLARQAAAQQRWWWAGRQRRPGEAPPLSDTDVERELRALVAEGVVDPTGVLHGA